jgi:drug/metabolite transporter (DMT)-like permease
LKQIWNTALGLLLVTGGFLGLTPPLGKIATAAGVPALLWAFVISAGAGGVLLIGRLARAKGLALNAHRLRYFVITAIVSFAVPNFLIFAVIPHLGAGYTGIMFTLSPVITLTLSLMIGVRRPNVLGIIGILVGFGGAALVATTRGEIGQPADLHWVLAGLAIPVSLAAGNIYRTVDWPEDTGPIELAVGSHLAAAAIILAGLFVTGDAGAFALLADIPLVVAAQIAAVAAMSAFFFRLQAVGGPVYLSQIGYVGAAVSLLAGVFFLGERYAASTWIGAAITAVGVVMTTRAQSGRP